MNTKELIEYLSGFDPDTGVCFVAADVKNRIKFDVEFIYAITDMKEPFICLEIGESEPFDAEEVAEA